MDLLFRVLEIYRYIDLDYRGITCNKVLEGLQEHPLFSINPGESTVLKLNSGLRRIWY